MSIDETLDHASRAGEDGEPTDANDDVLVLPRSIAGQTVDVRLERLRQEGERASKRQRRNKPTLSCRVCVTRKTKVRRRRHRGR